MFKQDWRITATTQLAKDFISPSGELFEASNTFVTVSDNIEYGDKILNIHLPNMSALFLNFSNDLFKEANLYFNEESNFTLENFLEYGNNKKYLIPKYDKDLFDNMGKIASSIVFSFTSLETLCNEIIPNNYIYTHKNGKKKGTELNKEKIEKELSLDVKLGDILPDILNIKNFKSLEIWRIYILLKGQRDMIIHLKDKNKFGDNVFKIWHVLISKEPLNPAIISENIIKYFYEQSKDIRFEWIIKAPF